MKELVLGCGHNPYKRLFGAEDNQFYKDPTTVDIDRGAKPNVLWDLNNWPLPFPSDEFDEIHAYHVLEHLGAQGDARLFLREWSEYWRVLKPGGMFFGIVPAEGHSGAWGDPGHVRVINPMTLVFLNQAEYAKQVGKTAMSDYRHYSYKVNFRPVFVESTEEELRFILKKEPM